MKKITILALHLGTGGAENVISNIANIFSDKYDVEIISTYKIDDKPAFQINDNVKIIYLIKGLKPNREVFISDLKHLKIISAFKEGIKAVKILYLKRNLMIKKIKELDSDIVISTRVIHNKWLGKYGKKNCVKIAQEHNHHNNNKKTIKKVIKSLKNIDYFMPVSKELTEFYTEELKNKNIKVLYIPNCIEMYPEKISNLDNKNIISVGRIEKVKGFLDLLDIFKEINKKFPYYILNIVGDGSQLNDLKQKAKTLNIDKNIIFHGFKNKKELSELYLNSEIYVMTSFSESFGLVLIEAESYGLPLIAFDSAQGANEIIKQNENGFLISNRNKDKMVKKISELIENKELREKIGKNARENSNLYTKEVIQNKWYDFIDKL